MDKDLNKFEFLIGPVRIYACSIVSMVGFVLTTLSYFVFNSTYFRKIDKEKFKNYELYFFLRTESVFICLNLFFQILRIIFFNNTLQHEYISTIFELYLLDYFAGVLEMSAIICHILSTLNFYMIVSNQNPACCSIKCCKQSYNRLALAIVFFFSCIQFIYKIIGRNVEKDCNNQTRCIYEIQNNAFGNSDSFKIWEIIAFLMRDVCVLIALIILNILIYIRVNKSIKYKKSILELSYSIETSSNMMEHRPSEHALPRKSFIKLERAKISTSIMVICSCLNNVLGKIPICIFYLLKNTIIKDKDREKMDALYLFQIFAILFVYMNYCGCFFIYYFSNKSFKLVLWQYFKPFFSKFSKTKVTPSK